MGLVRLRLNTHCSGLFRRNDKTATAKSSDSSGQFWFSITVGYKYSLF